MTPSPPFDEWHEAFFTPEQMSLLKQLSAEPDKIWRNSRYQVLVRKAGPESKGDGWPDTVHLSIKRLDREPIHDWRDLQRIKNELVGPEHEALELYPAESRVQDGANQYHLWCFADPKTRIPLGWQGMKHDGPSIFGEKQRPFEVPHDGKTKTEEMRDALKNCLRLMEDENLDELHGDLAEIVRDLIGEET